ncbi:pyridoxamine 5'-phosphate oxidase family protein [Bacillus solimangrovi]|uniref:Pyridoxamine 5'-phosphate oxidase N-terminal domain-containing protein n=1 Tax=Bacillus solimangrovi TaxID=1305675 RepID=A0A1E5LIJ2_9BACI|nr:pyridoxamine 5'-phosphate oxidase family protein [Bacillus solimangrovi]OEH93904.1 hypothetical protein BFG57_10565 [Bacillus solimangrovi]
MANRVETHLTDELLLELQKERYVTIATVDFETGGPNVNAISWVYAVDEQHVRFAVDNRSRIIDNVSENKHVTITVIANGTTYSISGTAQVKVDKMEDIPLKLALVEIEVNAVRDVMFYGSKITQNVEYDKTYDKAAAEKLDRQVMDAMKRA